MIREYVSRPIVLLLYIVVGISLAVALDLSGVDEGFTFAVTMGVLGAVFVADNLVLNSANGRSLRSRKEQSEYEVDSMPSTNSILETLGKGKYTEFLVFTELLKRGANLYLPVVDRGIDAIIRKPNGECVLIQVKGTEAYEQAGYFNVYDLEQHPRDSFFIVCVDLNKENTLKGKDWPNIWIVSVEEFEKYMTSGNRLPIYERSRRHDNKKRYELLEHTFKAWWRLVDESHSSVV